MTTTFLASQAPFEPIMTTVAEKDRVAASDYAHLRRLSLRALERDAVADRFRQSLEKLSHNSYLVPAQAAVERERVLLQAIAHAQYCEQQARQVAEKLDVESREFVRQHFGVAPGDAAHIGVQGKPGFRILYRSARFSTLTVGQAYEEHLIRIEGDALDLREDREFNGFNLWLNHPSATFTFRRLL